MAYDVFDTYYAKIEESINLTESICKLLETMSPEDEHDSAILREIIRKTSERTNAKLTQEEKDILAKYDLYRDDRKVKMRGSTGYVGWSDFDLGNPEGGDPKNRGRYERRWDGSRSWRKRQAHHDDSKINYADIARKRPARERARLARYTGDKLTEYQEAQRALSAAIWSRDHHQRQIDNADQEYFAAIQKAKKAYDDAVNAANRNRDSIDSYHTPARDRALGQIDSIYAKFKK